ncbi:hypothetical protein [Hydrococcus rivularis]|nr:hypothetical protein [Hydrococcus rivularis]
MVIFPENSHRPHPQPLSQTGRGEKDVDRENMKIGIIINKNTFDY